MKYTVRVKRYTIVVDEAEVEVEASGQRLAEAAAERVAVGDDRVAWTRNHEDVANARYDACVVAREGRRCK